MNRVAVAALSLLAAVVMVSCSSDGSRQPTVASLDTALRSMDCAEYVSFEDDDWSTLISETYECSIHGEAVALHEVEEDQERLVDALAGRYQSADSFAPCEGQPFPTGFRVVAGDGWVVVTASSDAAAEVVRLVGGTVQPTPYGGGPPISYQHPALECR